MESWHPVFPRVAALCFLGLLFAHRGISCPLARPTKNMLFREGLRHLHAVDGEIPVMWLVSLALPRLIHIAPNFDLCQFCLMNCLKLKPKNIEGPVPLQ